MLARFKDHVSHLLTAVLVSVSWLLLAAGTRFDVLNPIVNEGDKLSMFGYSLTFHSWAGERRLVVGAPNGSSPRNAIRVVGVDRPGAIYSCTLRAGSVESKCNFLQLVTTRNELQENRTLLEEQSWMRLGASMTSTSLLPDVAVDSDRQLVVCAPGYKFVWWWWPEKIKFREGNLFYDEIGRCYILQADISAYHSLTKAQFRKLEPCRKIPNWASYGWDWARFCMTGTSLDIQMAQSGRRKFPQLVTGAPYRYPGAGQVHLNDISDPVRTRSEGYKGPLVHLGQAVAVANFDLDPENTLEIAASRPMQGYIASGGVAIIPGDMDNPLMRAPGLEPKAKGSTVIASIDGIQTGEAFGYSLCAIDITGDRKPELLVGAPLWVTEDPDISGHVYIFEESLRSAVARGRRSNSVSGEQLSAESDTMDVPLSGQQQSWFGATIASLGDVNQDGINDVAIGAPFEQTGKERGTGAVYVYLGSSKGLQKPFAQRISGSDLSGVSNPLQAFGFSLSRGHDFDGNGYSDLAIGSPLSNAVVVLRARPIVSLRVNMTKVAGDAAFGGLQNCSFNLAGQQQYAQCVQVKICGMKTGTDKKAPAVIEYVLEAGDWLTFDAPSLNLNTRTFQLHVTGETGCEIRGIFLRPRTDVCQQATVAMTSWRLVDVRSTPSVLSPTAEPSKGKAKELPPRIRFGLLDQSTSCPGCHADLSLMSTSLKGRNGETEVVIGQTVELVFRTIVRNKGKVTACRGFITLQLDNNLGFAYLEDAGFRKCTATSDTGEVTCSLSLGLSSDKEEEFKFILSVPADLNRTIETLAASVSVESANEDGDSSDNTERREVKTRLEALVYVSGSPSRTRIELQKETDHPMTVAQLGPRLEHELQVINEGPSEAPASEVRVRWPATFFKGTDILYLESVQTDRPGLQCNATELINPRGYKDLSGLNDPNNKRLVRNYTESGQPVSLPLRQALECPSSQVLCYVEVRCSVPGMKAGGLTTISLQWRVYSTLSDSERRLLPLTMNSTITLLSVRAGDFERFTLKQTSASQETTTVSTRLFATIAKKKESVKWWIIFLAVLAGLVTFFICLIIMWKLGFFKRKMKEEMNPSGQS